MRPDWLFQELSYNNLFMKKGLAFSAFILLFFLQAQSQRLSVNQMRCEDRVNPMGVQQVSPRLSWQLQTDQRNVLQTAYRILVSDDSLLLKKNQGNIWDSKKVISSASIQVKYAGTKLKPAREYYWKLMIWNNHGQVSPWSAVASWQMGLLKPEDWSGAKWIGYDVLPDSAIIAPHVHLSGNKAWGARPVILPLLRKSFVLKKEIKKAIIFISGLGHFRLSVNGKVTGDHFLAGGWTNYSKQAYYLTYDITRQLNTGQNVLGVLLGNGFYFIPSQRYRKMTGGWGYPKLIAKVLIEYADESSEEVISDKSWKTASSPITFSSMFGGEDYDAGKEQSGWDSPGFNDRDWQRAVTTTGPKTLLAEMQEPVKILKRFTSAASTELKPGVTVYDLKQNFSGIPSITVRGSKGDTIRLFAAELINADGTANQKATGSPSWFTYVLKGEAKESWHPLFTYTGLRYIEAHCIPKDSGGVRPRLLNVEGLHISNAARENGTFSCSNELFNKTHQLIDWAIRSNMVSVFTDCPHREKLGWLEQTHLMGSSVQYRFDVASLNRKVMNDLQLSQYPDGRIPEIAPEMVIFAPPFDESPEWGSASVILPWYNYRWYGDRKSLEDAYPMMKKYVQFLKDTAKNHLIAHGLGDWFDIGPKKSGFAQMTKAGVTATATFYYDLTIMQRVAALLGKKADIPVYSKMAVEVKSAFNKAFFDPEKKQYDSASQTANAIALYMGLVEAKYRKDVADALVRDIQSRNNALTAGDIGYRYVIKALEEAGRSDIIFAMNSRDDVPGYGFQLKHGATALTESWQAYESVSNNHFMLGHLMEWFYSGLAGIRQTERSVAFNEVEIKPEPVGDITEAKASFFSPYGEIRSGWKKKTTGFEMNVTIPANSTAVIYVPAKPGAVITLNGRRMVVPVKAGKAILKTGSGEYIIEVNE